MGKDVVEGRGCELSYLPPYSSDHNLEGLYSGAGLNMVASDLHQLRLVCRLPLLAHQNRSTFHRGPSVVPTTQRLTERHSPCPVELPLVCLSEVVLTYGDDLPFCHLVSLVSARLLRCHYGYLHSLH
jgi:hypothetical protein